MFENNGAEWPDNRDKTGFAVWPGVGGVFCMVSAPAQQCGHWGGLRNRAVLPMQ